LLARAEANSAGLEDWQSANLREMRRERDQAIATPQNLVSRLAKATARAEVKWVEAKQKSDFASLRAAPRGSREPAARQGQLLGKALNLDPYDALVDEFSPGMTSAQIDTIFTTLGRRLPGLIQEVIDLQAKRPPLEMTGRYTPSKQRRSPSK
jgi:carboxypeptidase Taq